MHLKILLAVLMLVFGSFNCGVFGQTKITFVDSSGAPVPTVDAVFFNGGQGQTIEIKNRSGTVQASKGVVAATAKGFQYSGGILDSKDLKIVLLRVDEVASSVRQEQVAPEKVRSMIWEVVFRAIPRSSLLAENQMLQHTAGAIARYDHDLAIALIDIDNLEIRTWPKSGGFHQAILKAQDLPAYAAKISSPETHEHAIFRLQKELVDVLLVDEETFWRNVSKPIQLEWPTRKYEPTF